MRLPITTSSKEKAEERATLSFFLSRLRWAGSPLTNLKHFPSVYRMPTYETP
jgi:hypothetical protein